jgi:hypothetical protein
VVLAALGGSPMLAGPPTVWTLWEAVPRAPPSSRGLGHRPFKAAARVRIPLGAQEAWSCGAAWSARHPVKVEAAGSNPVRTAPETGSLSRPGRPGQVAQSVERPPEKRKVGGSIPPLPTTCGNSRARFDDNAPHAKRSLIGSSPKPENDSATCRHRSWPTAPKHLRKAYFAKLALRSAQARRRRREATKMPP